MKTNSRLLDEIDRATHEFESTHQRSPEVITFQKQKANELLLLDARCCGAPIPFIGRDGIQPLIGRTIRGLKIRVEGFGHQFQLGWIAS